MRGRYDGYHFEENAPGMYNPFSPFTLDGQQIIRLGISFDKETRNIDEVLVG